MTDTEEPKKLRLFLAVNLSVATTRKIADAIADMRRAAGGAGLRVAWVPPPNLHLTLKFLGWSNPEIVDAVGDVVGDGVGGRKAFEVEARGAGAFPTEHSARVLWVGLGDPTGGLAKLAADVDGWMAKLGYAKETRPFSPHVTIGRVKEGRGAETILAPHKQTLFGTSLIREVVLYESRMKASGSEYTARLRLPLDAPPFKAERQARESAEAGDDESPEPSG